MLHLFLNDFFSRKLKLIAWKSPDEILPDEKIFFLQGHPIFRRFYKYIKIEKNVSAGVEVSPDLFESLTFVLELAIIPGPKLRDKTNLGQQSGYSLN